jgi:hypothetical protein
MLTGLARASLDQFYTLPTIAARLVADLDARFPLSDFAVVVEPAAGAGAFVAPLRGRHPDVRAYDLAPPPGTDPANIATADFFQVVFPPLPDGGRYAVVGNPPFGRQSALARRFIQRAAAFADLIAFILPRSFKKPALAHAFPAAFHLEHSEDLPLNAFVIGTRPHAVPCVFQIWRRRAGAPDRAADRATVVPAADAGYSFICADAAGAHPARDLAFWGVGAPAGAFAFGADVAVLSPQSHYFIRAHADITPAVRARLAAVAWDTDNTVGPRSISKRELVARLATVFVGRDVI